MKGVTIMKERCPICGDKIPKFLHAQIGDGAICVPCSRICNRSTLATAEAVKAAWEENHQRFKNFKESVVITELMAGFIFVDMEHKWAYISNQKKQKQEPVVFSFSEIEEYRIEKVGEKTITKTKGGITRAVVGGALFGVGGAIVGASTAKQETKTTGGVSMLYIDLDFQGVKTTVSISNPPMKAAQTLDSMIDV